MNKKETIVLWVVILAACYTPFCAFYTREIVAPLDHSILVDFNDNLKNEVYEILVSKCNACHRKQNPFMVFKIKNMDKRAAKIKQTVFDKKTMPKGNTIRLTKEEYLKIKKWVFIQNKNQNGNFN